MKHMDEALSNKVTVFEHLRGQSQTFVSAKDP